MPKVTTLAPAYNTDDEVGRPPKVAARCPQKGRCARYCNYVGRAILTMELPWIGLCMRVSWCLRQMGHNLLPPIAEKHLCCDHNKALSTGLRRALHLCC